MKIPRAPAETISGDCFMKRFAAVTVLAVLALLTTHAVAAPAADELMVERFERSDEKNELGQAWRNYADTAAEGGSRITTRRVEEDGNHFLRLEVTFGNAAQYPFAGAGTLLNEGGQPRDMSDYTGIKLRTRSDGSYTIHLMTTPVTDHNEFSATVSRRGRWSEVEIPFNRFKQNRWWGKQVEFDLTQVTGISIHIPGAHNAPPVVVEVDDIQFY